MNLQSLFYESTIKVQFSRRFSENCQEMSELDGMVIIELFTALLFYYCGKEDFQI